ncbi:MAG: M23 family metallopeptidase [Candidatus Binatia bacterium]
MDPKYSILILPWRGTGMRRVVLSRKLLRYGLWAAVVVVAVAGWLIGDYLGMKIQRESARQYRAEVETQREKLSALQQMTRDLRGLVMKWKRLDKKIEASVPPQARIAHNEHRAIDELENTLVSLETQLQALVASIPTEWPVSGRVTSGVGMRLSPWTGTEEFHSGLDIPNPIGTPVRATADGVVDFAGASDGNGTAVVLNHGRGIATLYAHLSKTHVQKGDQVRRGDTIADVGNTGRSTSPHLHYEVRVNGVPIDPRDHLLK